MPTTNTKPAIDPTTLAYFNGTLEYHAFPNITAMPILLTDGMLYVVENGGGWIADLIWSYLTTVPSLRKEPFITVRIEKVKHTDQAIATISEGNSKTFASQHIEYTDLPVDKLTMFVLPIVFSGRRHWCFMLSSEY